MADDDWRVTVTFDDEAHVRHAIASMRDHRVENDVRRRLGDRVAVSADGPSVFLYAGTEDAAREADRVVREVLAQRQLTAAFKLDRWHPIEQEWEDAGAPLPQTAEQREAEEERRVADETEESEDTGQTGYEVLIEVESRHEAVELAKRLQSEGHPVIRRWRYVVLGANNEDEARDLAQSVQRETPSTASVQSAPVPFAHFDRAAGWRRM
ncbi:MAG TPA: hypothetical protein VGI37_05155 [Streptosporangiaceae bacterium]